MPISVKCPECEAPYKVPDEAAGKAIKCKKCGAKISIPAAEADPGDGGGNDFAGIGPGAESGGAESSEAKAKKKGNTTKILVIVGALLAVSCCVCGGGGATLGYFYIYKPGVDAAKKIQDDLKNIDKNFDKNAKPPGNKVMLDQKRIFAAKPALAPKQFQGTALSRGDLLVELWVSSADFANTPARGRRGHPASVAVGQASA